MPKNRLFALALGLAALSVIGYALVRGPAPRRQAPVVPPPELSATEARDPQALLAALGRMPQADAARRGVATEDYLALLSAVDASICATPKGALDPVLPAAARARLQPLALAPVAMLVARYLLVTGRLPPRVETSLRTFLRTHAAYSPGERGWTLAALAIQLDPASPHHLYEVIRENGAFARWRTPSPEVRFGALCERGPAVEALLRRVPGPLGAALASYLKARPIGSALAVGPLSYTVLSAERDEAAATLTVHLRIRNSGSATVAVPLTELRLRGLADPPSAAAPLALGPGAARELPVTFEAVTDLQGEAAVLVVAPKAELRAYSEDLR